VNKRKIAGVDYRVNTGVEHYTERVHSRGMEAQIAAEELGPEWSAKNASYTGHPKPCCLCKDDQIVERFTTWEALIESVSVLHSASLLHGPVGPQTEHSSDDRP